MFELIMLLPWQWPFDVLLDIKCHSIYLPVNISGKDVAPPWLSDPWNLRGMGNLPSFDILICSLLYLDYWISYKGQRVSYLICFGLILPCISCYMCKGRTVLHQALLVILFLTGLCLYFRTLNDDSPLGLRRILSQSTDSLSFRARAMSVESLTDDGIITFKLYIRVTWLWTIHYILVSWKSYYTSSETCIQHEWKAMCNCSFTNMYTQDCKNFCFISLHFQCTTNVLKAF